MDTYLLTLSRVNSQFTQLSHMDVIFLLRLNYSIYKKENQHKSYKINYTSTPIHKIVFYRRKVTSFSVFKFLSFVQFILIFLD
nr:MAG TPA: hypothetical protein [Caudoviricetes sp.]